MNTRLKLLIAALFFTSSVSIASAMTLIPLNIYGIPDTPAPIREGNVSSYFYYATYTSDGVPYFHGTAHAEASTDRKSQDVSVGSREQSSVKQEWGVKLILGGGSSTFSNVWIKYPVDSGNKNGTSFTGYTNNRGDTTDHFSATLSFNKEGLPPVTFINEDEYRSISTFLGGTKSIDEFYTYTDSFNYVLLGAYQGGTIFDIKGSFLASVDSHAWGAGGFLEGTARGGVSADLTFEVFATPVPEPETWTMMFVGVLLLAWQTRRRVRKHLSADVPLLGYMPS